MSGRRYAGRVPDPATRAGAGAASATADTHAALSPRKKTRRPDAVAAAGAATWLATATPAAAAASDAVPSALAAYGHYLGIILVVGALVTERVLLRNESLDDEEFDLLAAADITYGLAGFLVIVSGYFRATAYGKGWEFYAHEPIFWFKLTLAAVAGVASFFPTIKIVQHAIAKKDAEDAGEAIAPVSPALVARMRSIVNAEILAVASIPAAATLMARGVGYADWLPWQAGALPVAAALGGLGYKYIAEAIAWED